MWIRTIGPIVTLVVANLIKVAPRHGRTLAIIIGTILFAAVHYPYPWLMLATGGLACFFIPWYLRDRNLWPLGLDRSRFDAGIPLTLRCFKARFQRAWNIFGHGCPGLSMSPKLLLTRLPGSDSIEATSI